MPEQPPSSRQSRRQCTRPPEKPAPAEAPVGHAPRLESVPVRTRVPWAELLKKVFAVDVLACPRCAGRLEVIAYIAQPEVAKQILDHLGLEYKGPPLARARADGPDAVEPVPEYDCVDPSYDE